MLVSMMAGCWTGVSCSAASGPLKMISLRENPSVSSAAAYSVAISGSSWMSSRPMPTRCEPCPGKTQATFPRSGSTTGERLARSRFRIRRLRRGDAPGFRDDRDGLATLLIAADAGRSPTHHAGRPGQPAAEGDEDDVIPLLQIPSLRSFEQGNRDRGRRRIAVAVEIDPDLLAR